MSNATYTYDEDCYSDLHKDAYGFRPRGSAWEAWVNMNPDQKQAEWDFLIEVLARRMAEDDIREQECIATFEATVALTIENGAKDRETAIRWLMDADECMGDVEYFCYHNGLPYNYFRKAA